MKIEYIESKSHGSTVNDTVHVNIDGKKTNLWYRLPPYKYYDPTGDENNRARIELYVNWIKEGLIYPESGNWENFDICATKFVYPENIQVVKEIPYDNKIISCQGYETRKYQSPEGQAEIIAEYTGKRIFTQYTRMVFGNTLSEKVGIAFFHWGYDLGFIKP